MTTNPPQHASDFEAIYWPDCAQHWPEFEHMITIVEDKRLEQAILEAAEKNSDDLMDLLQKAIETMDEVQAEHLIDKVHQVQSENLRDLRGWREEIDGTA